MSGLTLALLLPILTAEYTKETGKQVAVVYFGMGGIVNVVKTANPPADVIMLPFELMSTVSLDEADRADCPAPARARDLDRHKAHLSSGSHHLGRT